LRQRRGNDRSLARFQPTESPIGVGPERAANACASEESLEEPRGSGWPFSAVVAPVVEANADD
jgi:hypothetical protein